MENRAYNTRIFGVRGCGMNPYTRVALVCFLLAATSASAAVKSNAIRIVVLDSETRSLNAADNGVPKNCDGVNFDAYCHSSTTAAVINTLLVQEGNHPPFRIACTIEARWSRCVPLPKGESFDAKREKRGLVIYYPDDNGKVRGQLYTYVASDANTGPAESPAATPAQSPAQPPAPAVVHADPAPVAAPAAVTPQASVKCSFASTPSGAEVTLDGKYVGSTPSVVGLSTGTHVVQISLPGFAQWKRELTISPGSELTVNAVLEKEK